MSVWWVIAALGLACFSASFGVLVFAMLTRGRQPATEILRLEPGDHIILKARGTLSQRDVEQIRAQAVERFDGHQVTVVSDMDVSIIRSAP